MFIHSRSSLEIPSRFQTKMEKVYTRFQTKTAQNPVPDGAAHTYMAYIKEYPRGVPTNKGIHVLHLVHCSRKCNVSVIAILAD